MSTRVHLFSDWDGLDFSHEDGGFTEGGQTIWIVSEGLDREVVSLTLNREDRAKLRAALDQADAAESAA